MATNEHIDLNEENGIALVATAITLLVLSWISVGLRVYTRAWLMSGQQLDDWLMLIAQVHDSLIEQKIKTNLVIGHIYGILRFHSRRCQARDWETQ